MTGSARVERVVVPADQAGHRLDVVLARAVPTLSRSQIQRLIRSGHVTAAAETDALKASTPVGAGWEISVTLPAPAPAAPQPENLPLAILYDDEDVVVVDKPAGVVVHPAAGHSGGTLVNALLHHVTGLSGVGGTMRPGIVHRLDRGTSGVMVIAKHDAAHRHLARQFHDRTVRKAYVALVWGTPAAGSIVRPIGRDPKHRLKMSSRATRARTAETTITHVEPLGPVALVGLAIGTGRTHQIRVHLSEANHAVVGDELYGGVRRRVPRGAEATLGVSRPFLHACRLEFTHPSSGRRIAIDAPLPPDLSTVLAALRASTARNSPPRVSAAPPWS